VGYPASNLDRYTEFRSDGHGGYRPVYTPPDIIKRQAIRANLLAKATATNFGGFRSSSEVSQGVGL
jgi:hypothetical protein